MLSCDPDTWMSNRKNTSVLVAVIVLGLVTIAPLLWALYDLVLGCGKFYALSKQPDGLYLATLIALVGLLLEALAIAMRLRDDPMPRPETQYARSPGPPSLIPALILVALGALLAAVVVVHHH
jgi:hypothetical protein